ncbi:beta-agarase [Rhodopirellula bahusiensis]|uniref:Beta-agarase n=2 Tax=Rhodopirellula bahusiensis TaxID=2014065 RepID=A0A2G1W0J4_9BACT|nr:beta-agarase [Rhodopirellula bahusiensis]
MVCFAASVSLAEDWDGLEVPASAESGTTWKLHPVSDDFNYVAKPTGKPKEFTKRWNDSFINAWKGPGRTEFNSGHSYVNDGHLGIHASRKPGTDLVYTGAVSSKETFRYPLYVEASVKISGLVLASNVWMLSPDSTEEIDIIEAYGSQRPGQEWTAQRLHISHHVFIREPFQDYQPTDEGSWYEDGSNWREEFHRAGVFWKDPWNLEYYIDGKKVRTVSGESIIDPHGYTKGNGLSKPMHLIIDAEDQTWRSDKGITPTDSELADLTKSIMWVDWIRVYEGVPSEND